MNNNLLLGICASLLFCGSANATQSNAPIDLTVTNDIEYGKCPASQIIGDFFSRFPPIKQGKSTSFKLEINFIEKTNEVEIYYASATRWLHGQPAPDGAIAFYSGETCEFLRAEIPIHMS